jgi:hypothetical protein
MSRQLRVEMEEVKLSLRLLHGSRFGIDRKGDKLHWTSFVAAMLTTPVSRNRPNYKNKSTKIIAGAIKFPYLSSSNSGSPIKS